MINSARLKSLHLTNLVGDVTHPCCSWMLAPLTGYKDGLTRKKYNWNFVQSSIHMNIEIIFGMFKNR
jgi:hypothetical protein